MNNLPFWVFFFVVAVVVNYKDKHYFTGLKQYIILNRFQDIHIKNQILL